MSMRWALILAVPLLAAAQSAAAPEPNHVVMPLLKRVLDFHIDATFAPQPLQRNATTVLLEFLVEGETFENWRRLVTVRALRGLGASTTSTKDIARQLFDPKPCGTSGRLDVGAEQPVVGPLKRSVVVISCGRSPGTAFAGDKAGQGEQDFIYLFRDDTNVYTLNYAVRGPGFDRPPIDPANAEAVLTQQFGEVRLCGSVNEPGCKEPIEFARSRENGQ